MKKSLMILFFAFAVAAAMAQNLDSSLEYLDQVSEGKAEVNWTRHTLKVTGSGVGPENVKDIGRRKILAKRAAMLDAQRNLLETVKGVRVTSSTRVQDLMLESDTVRSEADGLVKGMRETEVHFSSEGICELTIEVDFNDFGEFLLTALNGDRAIVKDDYPKFDWVAFRRELEATQTQLNKARSNLFTAREQLKAAQGRLGKVEQKLAFAEVRENDLKQALSTAKTELASTRSLIDRLNTELGANRVTIAVQQKDLDLTRSYLTEKRVDLERLSSELASYRAVSADKEGLRSIISQVRGIQDEVNAKTAAVQQSRPGPDSGVHSGLLVDARDTNARPSMAPAFLNETGQKLFSGTADFLKGQLDEARKYSKVGANPLVVKALKAINGGDLVFSDDDIKLMAGLADDVLSGSLAVLF